MVEFRKINVLQIVWYLCKSVSPAMIQSREVIRIFEASPLVVSTYHMLIQFPEQFWDKRKINPLEVELNNSLFSENTLNVPRCVICLGLHFPMHGLHPLQRLPMCSL